MSIETIKAVMPLVWPGVKAGIVRWTAAANGRRPQNLNHRVTEQVLWELARQGLLITPEQREILDAAEAWCAVGPDASDEEYDRVDLELHKAVRNCQRVAA